MARNMARFRMAGEVLVEMLALPEGTQVFDIYRDEQRPGVFFFVVEHPDLPELAEGGSPVEISPTLTGDRRANWAFFNWGLE